jgi:hypothetical protein
MKFCTKNRQVELPDKRPGQFRNQVTGTSGMVAGSWQVRCLEHEIPRLHVVCYIACFYCVESMNLVRLFGYYCTYRLILILFSDSSIVGNRCYILCNATNPEFSCQFRVRTSVGVGFLICKYKKTAPIEILCKNI